MSTPFHAADLLAELPRLRRYARVLTGDTGIADRLVEETLRRFRRTAGDGNLSPARHLELLALLRAVNAEKAASDANARGIGSRLPGWTTDAHSRPAKWIQGQGAARSLPDRAVEMLAQLGELPAEQREVLVLVAVEQLSYADIATLVGVPVATVVSRLSQAREALHAMSTNPRSAPTNAG